MSERCPCCGYQTLDKRGIYDICSICEWEDDGQDDYDANEVLGGPNSDYSLTEARNNFKKYLTYRREGDIGFEQSNEKLEVKRTMINLYKMLNVEKQVDKKEIIQNMIIMTI